MKKLPDRVNKFMSWLALNINAAIAVCVFNFLLVTWWSMALTYPVHDKLLLAFRIFMLGLSSFTAGFSFVSVLNVRLLKTMTSANNSNQELLGTCAQLNGVVHGLSESLQLMKSHMDELAMDCLDSDGRPKAPSEALIARTKMWVEQRVAIH